jgi:hypothetical protein
MTRTMARALGEEAGEGSAVGAGEHGYRAIVFEVTQRATSGARVRSCWGLKPRMMRSGMRFASPMMRTVRMPGTGVPLGRTAVKLAGSSPAASQPATMADPMLPQPMKWVVVGMRIPEQVG